MPKPGQRRNTPVHLFSAAVDERHQTAYIGMVIFLGSWAVMFAGLFFAFAMHRVDAVQWPPASIASISLSLPLTSTALILLSSMTLHRYGRLVSAGSYQASRRWLKATLVLAIAFIGAQLFLWYNVHGSGLTPETDRFMGHLYLMTGFHALHVFVGFVLLGRLISITDAGPSPRLTTNARLVPMFWHFVGVAWVLIFLLLFVL